VNSIHIGDSLIGVDQPTYIIAEIGINHNGDMNLAKQLIDVSAEAKVDAVKFQKRNLSSLYQQDVLDDTLKYEQNFQYMIPILKQVELSENEFIDLKKYTDDKGLEFLCTPFDIPSAEFLTRLAVNAYKIASADLSNLELLAYVADKGKPMIVSTGMSYWSEIEKAVKLLQQKKVAFALMHCRSVYPVWPREVNLRMINKLGEFGCPVGYSGHDIGITIPLIAASMGACLIEKHITLDKKLRGPDHKISLEPHELSRLIRDIRVADQAVGRQNRSLLRGEILNRELFGKSLIAANDLSKDTRVTREMVNIQGPGKGLPPSRIDELIGTVMRRDLKKEHFFLEEDIESLHSENFTNSFRSRWGLICRFADFDKMLSYRPKTIEFHLAEKDFQINFAPEDSYTQGLVVHAPEYIRNKALDLCSASDEIRSKSIEMVQQTIDLTRDLAPHFQGIPKVIAHPGAMSLYAKLNKEPLKTALKNSLDQLNQESVELLLENLPPYPWYFGGQWKGNYFMAAEEIRTFCKETEYNICFDLSHAALYCNAKHQDLSEYIQNLMPYIRHVHFADGYGLDGEGVQIGEGDIDFKRIMPLFADYQGTWVPEIWRGHLNEGRGFIEALIALKKFNV
jgi:N-acetylneuraminate synthase